MKTIKPYLVSEIAASGRALIPVSIGDKLFDEDWLQELLFHHPSILPVTCLDESDFPLVSIGREIANIDNLFISPSGLLTIVETKLWRNPEAHETVVAEILEYANTLSTWNYKKLDNAVKQYTQKQNNIAISIFEAVNKAVNSLGINEFEFQAKVQDSLKNGRFSLIIVGDRIHPQATQISETIQSAPNLQLSLSFIELCCYKLEKNSNWPLIIVPNCITKTKELTRAVVRVIYEEKRPDVRIETVQEEGETTSQTKLSIFIASLPNNIRDVFKIYLERWMRQGYAIYWGKVGFSLRIPWKGDLTTVFDAYPYYLGILSAEYVKRYKLPEDSFLKYKEALITSSIIGSALAAERSYYDYTDMTVDDVMLILKVVDDFVSELSHK